MSSIIELENLTKTFRQVPAVNDLTLSIPQGAVTAFLGPNGAGKTTTIKCLLNLQIPDSGYAKILGCDSRKLGPNQLQRIGYVSENQELPGWMNVTQLLDYLRPMYPDWDRDFEKKLLGEFNIPMKTKLRSLSRGQRMKAALLSSLAYRPQVVILDEPFSGLDPLVRDEFLHGLLELTEVEGWSVLISSHDIDEVQRLCDRVTILNRGHLELNESTDELIERFRRITIHLPETEELPADLPATWSDIQVSGRTVRFIDHRHQEAVLPSLIKEHFPAALSNEIQTLSLREIFVVFAKSFRPPNNPTSKS
ncbi:MAG: ABC transporter ATP-binding protein [Roseibacillus sp.]